MIAHISMPATDPRTTALLLAALIDGQAFEFPVVPGAWIAVANDGSGLAVEVYPDCMAHHPGVGEADPTVEIAGPATMAWEDQIYVDDYQVRPSAFHMALATRLSEIQIIALAQEAGIRAVRCERAGIFGLVELWIDGTFLIEVLTEAEVARYKGFMNPAGCAGMFGPGLVPQLAA
ncbi:hypothetical protein GRI89_10605 [Altererythrobacter salegens]|uniref:Uncharacterized protein n=1 Tax=Croceibacterium salegens TaxID=1737568 RepID=A0A6I4SXX0_9SPHN|nr:hypothetical protein [Croceibacterium salegens]MXO59990.1 hypothetical protein [Croceibacterium salegens]